MPDSIDIHTFHVFFRQCLPGNRPAFLLFVLVHQLFIKLNGQYFHCCRYLRKQAAGTQVQAFDPVGKRFAVFLAKAAQRAQVQKVVVPGLVPDTDTFAQAVVSIFFSVRAVLFYLFYKHPAKVQTYIILTNSLGEHKWIFAKIKITNN